QADDHTRLEVLGGCFLNWAPQKGPAIVSRDSRVFAVCYMWSKLPETMLREEANGVVGTLPATRFPLLGNSAIVFMQ
ncbi:MAG: hypothetical protein KJ579_05635, partial [Verrucomicrobia bacterium]|nr:hypothetical protein [Verrucomicrobiota bacterium]